MTQEIGKINSLDGSFFIKDAEGNLTSAKIGDTVYSGDIIVGSGSNSNSNSIKIQLSDNSKEIELYGDNQQLFDETMLTSELSSDTVVQDAELNESLLLEEDSTSNEIDPNDNQATLTTEDIENLDAAAAGGETGDAGVLLARLESRTGTEVDVNTELLDATNGSGGTIQEEDEDALVLEVPIVSLEATIDTAIEGETTGVVFTVSQTNESNFDTSVDFTLGDLEIEVADITSIIYTDSNGTTTLTNTGDIASFILNGVSLTIGANTADTPTVTLTPVDDDIYEIEETFTGNIALSVGETDAILGVSSDEARFIDEGDKPTVNIVATIDTAKESGNDNFESNEEEEFIEESQSVIFTISQTNESNFDTSVDFTLGDLEIEVADITSIIYTDSNGTTTLTNTGDIASFILNGVSLTIGANTADTPTVTLTPVDDDIYEIEETFTGNIALSVGETDAILGVSSDEARFIDEGENQEGDLPVFTISSAADSNANEEGLDAVTGTTGLTVNTADDAATFTITRTGLTEVEGSVVVTVGASSAAGDNDIEVADIQSLQYYDGSAWQNFNSGDAITVAVGGASKDVAIRVIATDDSIYENVEGFDVTISTPVAGTLGATTTVSGTITDIGDPVTDLPVFTISSAADSNANEEGLDAVTGTTGLTVNTADDAATFTITRTGLTEVEGSVVVTVGASSAAGDNDIEVADIQSLQYYDGSAWQNFNSGDAITVAVGGASKDVAIRVIATDDSIYENVEGFDVTISTPVAGTLGATTTVSGTITDIGDKPTVQIVATDDLAVEGSVGNTTLEFTVSQDNLSEFDTTVDLNLILGTVEVEDISSITYTDSSGTLVVLNNTSTINSFVLNGDTLKIEVGNLSAPSIVITVAQDNIYEASETLSMGISNPSNAILGTNSDTATIQDINTLPTSVSEEQTLTFDFNGSSTTNIVLILDTSGSMGNSAGNGQTRLSLAKDALENLINAYDNIGDVNVQLVEFAGSATSINYTSGDAAIAAINALTDGGSTNYEEAIESAIDNTTFTPSTDPTVNTLGFFITDGSPTSESDDPDSDLLSPSFVSDWNTFINTTLQVDQLNVIGIGTNINNSYLNELKVTSDPVVIVTDPNDLDATLQDTIVDGSVSGNALDNIDFNYNGGGQIDSIEIDGTPYNRTDIPVGSPMGAPLEITTPEGATLKFYFDSGNYDYEANSSNFMADVSEVITVYASDANGDPTSFNITINVDVDVVASPAILDVSLGNEILIPVAGEVIDVTNTFNSNLEGWMGDISRSSNEMEIESGSNSQAIKTFNFDTDYVGQPLTINFDTDIDNNGGSKWDSGTDEFIVEINGTQVYSEKDSSDLNNGSHTLTNIFLKLDGSLDVKLIVKSGGNSEWVEIDDFNIIGTFAPIINTYQYDMTINAGLIDTDGSEVLSDKVTLDNLPSGITLKDSNNDSILDNGDGTYTVEVDINGDATVTLLSDTQLVNTDIDDITASINTTELHGNATETVTVNVKAEIDGTNSSETINGTVADELIDGKAGSDTIDAGLGDDTLVYDENDLLLDGGSDSITDNDVLLLEGSDDIDFSSLDNSVLKNIDTVNLRDGNHEIEKLSLQDVIDMTDSTDKTLRITGDNLDEVELLDGSGAWTSASTQTIDTVTYDVYTNDENSSYKVLIQQEIIDTVI